MSGDCTYYASPAWRARVEASAKEWSMHMFLRFRNEAGVNQVRTNRGRTEVLDRLGDRLSEDPERLRWTPVWDLWCEHDADVLGFTWNEVVETWREVNILPDEATEDLASACPHEAVRDDRCIFHLAPDEKDDDDVRDALVDAIASGDPERRAFDGARFGSLDLSGRDLRSERTSPIDLRFAVVEGELDMSNVRIPESMFSVRFATVRGDATFRGARFGSTATFVGATFRRNASFYRTHFESKGRFTRTRFGTTADASTRGGDRGAPSTASEDGRRYATFAKATFERTANFHGAQFDARANFDDARFEGRAGFLDVVFTDGAHLREATFADVVAWRAPSSPNPIDLTGAHLERGVVAFEDGSARFDLERATLGQVTLPDADTALPRLRFHETDLDGFSVSGHREAFEDASWRLHGYDSDSDVTTRVGRTLGLWGVDASNRGDVAAIEGTYRRAKRGATASGDTTAASEFFRKEMAYRRFGHGYRLRSLPRWDGWVGLWRWAANMTMAVTTGYGERPSRVVLSSFVLCVGFAVAYAGGLAPASAGVPFQEYLLFSFQSFITFIVGTPPVPGTNSFGVRVASAAEGFLGAFFVALFVFALTRSVHR